MRRKRRWQAGVAAGLWMLMTGGPLEAREQPAAAQEAQPEAQEEEVLELSGVTLVGSRLQGRSAPDSAVPVDVTAREDLQTYGIRDMDALFAASVPSYNVNQQPIADAATLIRPANLRGLPPDSYDAFFEDIVEAGLTSINHERWLTDVELSYTLTGLPFLTATTIAFGAENVFDQYPRKSRWAPVLGNEYPPNSPYGFNGGFYYLRAGVEF